jgi:hypothetical protein
MTTKLRAYLASAAVAHAPGEAKLLELAGQRWQRTHADNANGASRALVERLGGNAYGQSARIAKLTVVSK